MPRRVGGHDHVIADAYLRHEEARVTCVCGTVVEVPGPFAPMVANEAFQEHRRTAGAYRGYSMRATAETRQPFMRRRMVPPKVDDDGKPLDVELD